MWHEEFQCFPNPVTFNHLGAIVLLIVILCFFEFRECCTHSDNEFEGKPDVLEENVEVNPNYHDEQNDGAFLMAKRAIDAAGKRKGWRKTTSD